MAPTLPPSPSSPSAAARREHLRRYKEEGTPMGVYAVRNLSNGRVLLGASVNAEGALNRHRFELQQRGHRNPDLQRDWLAQGGEQFAFEIVHRLKKSEDPAFDAKAELEALLVLWQEELDPQRRGYAPPGERGRA